MTPTCPECGGHEFLICVQQSAIVAFDGDEHEVLDGPYGDVEWDDDAYASCTTCNHSAPLSTMLSPRDAAIETLKAYGGQIALEYSAREEVRMAIAEVMPDFDYHEWAGRSFEQLVRHVLETDDDENI